MTSKYVIASQRFMTMPSNENIDIEVFFTLGGESIYTIDINKAFTFSVRQEAENMLKLLIDKDFKVIEVPEVTRGAK